MYKGVQDKKQQTQISREAAVNTASALTVAPELPRL